MLNFLFCDLDDTLFQSRRKTPAGTEVAVMAHGPQGDANGFMTQRQHDAFVSLGGFATLIPVTARDGDAYRRVSLPAVPYAVINHGGVILDACLQPLPEWHARVTAEADAARGWLEELHARALHMIQASALSATSRIIGDYGLPFYWLAKYRDEHVGHLDHMQDALVAPFVAQMGGEVWVHRNGNNLAVLPRTLQKSHAVRFLIEHLRGQHTHAVTWGMGDSESDIPFLLECDYQISPRRSQIAAILEERLP